MIFTHHLPTIHILRSANNRQPQVLCIGAMHWDIIGQTTLHMDYGADVPGKIIRMPGGVAYNIAHALCMLNIDAGLLSVVGNDANGNELIAVANSMGVDTSFVHRSDSLPTGMYMAIESAQQLVGAVADANSLELAGTAIIQPLRNGLLARQQQPWSGIITVDTNITAENLQQFIDAGVFAAADLRVAPASPEKADRMRLFLQYNHVTMYTNLLEAATITNQTFTSAADAARALVTAGAQRALVTNGALAAAEATTTGLITAIPPPVRVARVTGAGDRFMAAHIAAEVRGQQPAAALKFALADTALHISTTVSHQDVTAN